MKKNNRLYLVLAALTVVVVGVVYMLSGMNGKEEFIVSGSMDIKFNRQGELSFVSAESGEAISTIEIEVADNDQLRARGLMYRESMPKNAGMLFIFDYEAMQSFWMKNTYIALDILFVDKEMQIVNIHHNATPLKEWNYESTAPAMYVVEVNGGYCTQHGVKEGDTIRYAIDKKKD